jgi:5-methylcytosine-specific restriction protein A
MTNLFLLTWNPSKWEWDARSYARDVAQTQRGKRVASQWSVGTRRSGITRGDLCLLVRQHDQRGIVASGAFTSDVFVEPHWDGSGRDATYARISWDLVVPTEDRLPVEALKAQVPEVVWDRLQGSGALVPVGPAGRLIDLWRAHTESGDVALPEEPAIGTTYREGDVSTVLVNRYERDRRARNACVAAHGLRCSVCDLDFGEMYGPHGAGFIHVHHLFELSAVGSAHEVDPVTDLRPVCPNCHAMLHRGGRLLSIEELKKVIVRARRAARR